MPDTVRTLSALQTLLANNTTGAISPQDLRDAVISGVGYAYGRSTTTSITLTADDIVVVAGESGTAITLTLPLASAQPYKLYVVINGGATTPNVIIAPSGSDTISGETSLALSAQYMVGIVWSTGTTWYQLV